MISIAVDGYSGSGKGELCKGLAKRFKLSHLDTGAILRAMALFFSNLSITEIKPEIYEKYFEKIDIKIVFDDGIQKTLLCGKDVSSEIRNEKIGQLASKIAVIPKAMQKLNEISRDFASKNDCILDGRNITSEVLPNADVKFFLTASIECRAKRRFDESQKRGNNLSFESVLESLKERDYRDTHREFSTMVLTDDSHLVDNTNMTIEQTIDYCSKIVEETLKASGKISPT